MISGVYRGISLIGFLVLSSVAQAQAPTSHDAHASKGGGVDQATNAFSEANHRMHQGMAIDSSGNVDMDFARGMLAHHRGAVDIARIELEHGSDEQMRSLARDVIDAQQKEIELLENWIAEHDNGKTPQKKH